MELSVVICTHNPRRDYLERTLESLKSQTLPKDRWELVLVDNASKEPLSSNWDLSWHPLSRIVVEEEIGLTSARMRAIKVTTAAVLLFVDDDNLLCSSYLESVLRLAIEMPQLGCFGAGFLEPEFETHPDEALKPYLPLLALRQESESHWSNVPTDSWIPWGAGLVVTRRVADEHLKRVSDSTLSAMLGRKGESLHACEDDDFSWTACDMGLGKGIFPELKVTHLIASRRVNREYLLKMAEGTSYSQTLLLGGHMPGSLEKLDRPGLGKVLQALFGLKLSRFFHEGNRWWGYRSKSEIDQAFFDAVVRGRQKALDFFENNSL